MTACFTTPLWLPLAQLLFFQFYTVKDHLDRPYKVLRHNINAAAGSTDEVVFEEKDEVCLRVQTWFSC